MQTTLAALRVHAGTKAKAERVPCLPVVRRMSMVLNGVERSSLVGRASGAGFVYYNIL